MKADQELFKEFGIRKEIKNFADLSNLRKSGTGRIR